MVEPQKLPGQELIAKHIATLLERIKSLEKRERIRERLANNEGSEQGQENPGENIGFNTFFWHTTIVQSVFESDSIFTAFRAIPDSNSLWIIDTELQSRVVTVTVPDNIGLPETGDIVLAHFTGIYSEATAPSVRYGAFSSKADTEMSVQSVAEDHLVCRTIDSSLGIGSDDIAILKPWTLRRTPFDGKTVDGVSYVYNSNIERVADGTDTYKITPNYFVGAQILVNRQNNIVSTSAGQLSLIDKNEDARTWALT